MYFLFESQKKMFGILWVSHGEGPEHKARNVCGFIKGLIKTYLHFLEFPKTDMSQAVEILMEDKDPDILYNWYHGLVILLAWLACLWVP